MKRMTVGDNIKDKGSTVTSIKIKQGLGCVCNKNDHGDVKSRSQLGTEFELCACVTY